MQAPIERLLRAHQHVELQAFDSIFLGLSPRLQERKKNRWTPVTEHGVLFQVAPLDNLSVQFLYVNDKMKDVEDDVVRVAQSIIVRGQQVEGLGINTLCLV